MSKRGYIYFCVMVARQWQKRPFSEKLLNFPQGLENLQGSAEVARVSCLYSSMAYKFIWNLSFVL